MTEIFRCRKSTITPFDAATFMDMGFRHDRNIGPNFPRWSIEQARILALSADVIVADILNGPPWRSQTRQVSSDDGFYTVSIPDTLNRRIILRLSAETRQLLTDYYNGTASRRRELQAKMGSSLLGEMESSLRELQEISSFVLKRTTEIHYLMGASEPDDELIRAELAELLVFLEERHFGSEDE